MLTKEFFDKATTKATAGENGKVLAMVLAEELFKEKVKALTSTTIEDIRECNVVNNHYQIDTDSFLYRADENSYYIEEVNEDGTSNIVKGGLYFALSYIMNKTLKEYF